MYESFWSLPSAMRQRTIIVIKVRSRKPPQVMHKIRQGIEDWLAIIYLDRLGLVRMMADDHVGAGIDGEVSHLLLVLHHRQLPGAGIRLDLIGR